MNNQDIDFEGIIEIFNNEGKEAAKEYAESTYKTSYPNIQRRFKEETNYCYNRNTKKYELADKSKTQFMTLEQLYMEKPKALGKSDEDGSNSDLNPHQDEDIFKDVVVNLMKDKIQEISKYIHLEQSTNLVRISLKKLEENGYKIILS